jgi:hypothetical protein
LPRGTARVDRGMRRGDLSVRPSLVCRLVAATGIGQEAHPVPTKIQTIRGPAAYSLAKSRLFPLVSGHLMRVPPTLEESTGQLLAEEARLLLRVREEAPDLVFCPPGASRSPCRGRGLVYTGTPSSSHRCPTPDRPFRTCHGPKPRLTSQAPHPVCRERCRGAPSSTTTDDTEPRSSGSSRFCRCWDGGQRPRHWASAG